MLGNESEGSGGESGTKPGESELETPRVRKDMWGLPIHETGGMIDDGEDQIALAAGIAAAAVAVDAPAEGPAVMVPAEAAVRLAM